jgi:hypothetical protein
MFLAGPGNASGRPAKVEKTNTYWLGAVDMKSEVKLNEEFSTYRWVTTASRLI